MKTCTRCTKTLALEFFTKNKKSIDGVDYRCKRCNAEKTKQYRREHPPTKAKLAQIRKKDRRYKATIKYKTWMREYAHRPEVKERIKKKNAATKQYLAGIKLSVGCKDCGYKEHEEALDFDHRIGEIKLFGIGDSCNRTIATYDKEIGKCDVVCANCHRVRTANRRKAA